MTKTVIAAGRLKRCRFHDRRDNPCPNPAIDQSDDAEIFVCMKHAARVLKLVAEAKAARLGLARPAS